MSITSTIRERLGAYGAFVAVAPDGGPTVDEQRAGVRRLEAAGYSAIWTNETVGADALVRAALWLSSTERAVVGTGVANMWVRPAQTARAAAVQLAQAFPDRVVLGFGVGYPEQAASVDREFGRPVDTARAYLSGLGELPCPVLLGANGPRLTALAGELADGVLPAGKPPLYTAEVRAAMPDALLAVYLPIQIGDDPATVSARVAEHRAQGADHVLLGYSYRTEFREAVDLLERLAADDHMHRDIVP